MILNDQPYDNEPGHFGRAGDHAGYNAGITAETVRWAIVSDHACSRRGMLDLVRRMIGLSRLREYLYGQRQSR